MKTGDKAVWYLLIVTLLAIPLNLMSSWFMLVWLVLTLPAWWILLSEWAREVGKDFLDFPKKDD